MHRIETTAANLAATRQKIHRAGGRIVSSSPAGRGYVVHYVIRGGAR